MYFAYFDESGDTGLVNTQTATFSLACLLLHDSQWMAGLDKTVSFRTYLKRNFRITPRMEIKASWLIHNKGDIRPAGLTFPSRMAVYKAAMRFQRTSGLFRAFAVLIDKNKIRIAATDIRETAWRYALQRLERFGTANNENIHVIPDEGHSDFIKKKIRQMRRFNYVPSAFGVGTLKRLAENIVEDPSERRSRESFFIQLADLDAYAAFRNVFPAHNVSGDLWNELGDARISEVTKLKKGGPVGIVVWPP
jgi:hypothetical protein